MLHDFQGPLFFTEDTAHRLATQQLMLSQVQFPKQSCWAPKIEYFLPLHVKIIIIIIILSFTCNVSAKNNK